MPQIETLGLPAGLMTGLPLASGKRNMTLSQWKDITIVFQLDTLQKSKIYSQYN